MNLIVFHLYTAVRNWVPCRNFLTGMNPQVRVLTTTTPSSESNMAAHCINRRETIEIHCFLSISVCLYLNKLSAAHSTIQPLSVDIMLQTYLIKFHSFYWLVLVIMDTSIFILVFRFVYWNQLWVWSHSQLRRLTSKVNGMHHEYLT